MRTRMKTLAITLGVGLVATACSHSGYPLSRDYHNMSHRDLRVAHQGSHAGHRRHGAHSHADHHRRGGHSGHQTGHRDGYYSRDYRSGNGYRGRHRYGGRRLPNGWSVSDRVRLDPWLNNTGEGQKFVRDHYDVTRYDTIDEDTAENANVFFRRWADIDRDYRLTDEEIRNALRHTAGDYGFDAPRHSYPQGDMRGHARGAHHHHHRGHGHHRRPAAPVQPLEPIIEEAPQIPYGERG